MRQILLVHQIPTEQVKFINLGQNSLTYISLKTGLIDATTLQVPQTFFAQEEGFRKLAVTADYYRVVQGGLTTTKATLTERPELVGKVIRATLRALRLLANDRKSAWKSCAGPISRWALTGNVLSSVPTTPRCKAICSQAWSTKNSSAK